MCILTPFVICVFKQKKKKKTSHQLPRLKENIEDGSKRERRGVVTTKLSKALTCFPRLNGTYLYFIMCMIWRFIVRTNRTIQ
jgi:hypothetical protein